MQNKIFELFNKIKSEISYLKFSFINSLKKLSKFLYSFFSFLFSSF